MHEDLYRSIFTRKSVRKYMPEPLDQGTLDRLATFTSSMKPLFPNVPVQIKVLGREDSKGMFKVDAPHYLAIFSEGDDREANAGLMLQQADLFLSSIGLGSCWQGGPRPTKEVKKVAELDYVIMLALGRPAEKAVRSSVAEFKRKPLGEISEVKGRDEIMEAVRLAPSGMNNQSWRFTGDEGVINAYAARSMITDKMNRINVGIALCHMWLAAEHEGLGAEFVKDQGAAERAPSGHTYVASMRTTPAAR